MSRLSVWFVLAGFALTSLGCGGGEKPAAPTSGGADPVQNTEVTPSAGETAPTPNPGTPSTPATTTPAATVKDVPKFIIHAKENTALVVIRPSKALSNPLVKELLKKVNEADPSVRFEEGLDQMAKEIGVHPNDVEYVVVSASQESLKGMTPFGGPPSDNINSFDVPTDDSFNGPPVDAFPPTNRPDFNGDKLDEAASPESAATSEEKADCAEVAVESSTGEAAIAVDVPAGAVEVDAPFDADAPFPADPLSEIDAEMDAWQPPPPPIALVRLKTPVDREKFIAAKEEQLKNRWGGFKDSEEPELDPDDPFAAEMKKYREEAKARVAIESKVTRFEYKGFTLLQAGGARERACFLNDQTIIFGAEADIHATIDRNGTEVDSPLIKQISAIADRDLAIAVDLAPYKEILGALHQQAPFPVQMAMGPALQSKGLTLSADLEGKALLEVQIIATGEQEAQNIHSILNPLLMGQLEQAKQMKAQAVEEGQVPPEALPLLPLADMLINGISMTTAKDVVSLTVTRPAGLEELPTLLGPALAKVAESKKKSMEMNDLFNIALAFHNFDSAYGTFPANNRGGNVDGPTGLSWRVHLLPFVEEEALYEEFHLDEPWDSDHNKTLIARMPAIYGSNAEGKSSFHVFVGADAPFETGKAPRIRDITDGTSNTILFVKAGEDTADIWTKPGGIEFNSADPMAALGNIGEDFLVAFMDGFVRRLPKSIEAETMSNLIRHNDGNPVDLPD